MMRRALASLFKPLGNQNGVALLIALFALTLLIFVAVEVSYDTNVDYIVARQQVNRLKAYYAARSGVELSLLRVLLYKKAVAALGETLGPNVSMLDPIWQVPFAWPPVLPDSVSDMDRGQIQDVVKNSSLDTQYLATIEPEGGKIDVNDLGSASKVLQATTKAQLLKAFRTEVEHNERFSDKYRDFKFEELVNNMVDWVDPDSESLNGGSERDYYRDIIAEDSAARALLPPNQPFKTMKEINMVAGMDEGLFQFLMSRVTIFGTKGININYAPQEVLEALDPSMNEKAVQAVIKRRSNPNEGGPFRDERDFFGFIRPLGVNTGAIEDSGTPLLFGVEFNFRIRADGLFGNVKRSITAVTYDIENLQGRYLKIMEKELDEQGSGQPPASQNPPPGGSTPPTDEKVKIKPPKGRPTVVYWEES